MSLTSIIVAWCEKNRSKFDSRWRPTDSHLWNWFWHDYRDDCFTTNTKPVQQTILRSEFDLVVGSMLPARALAKLRAELQYDGTIISPDQLDWANKAVLAATGDNDQLDVAVFRHWLWNVKRKMFGRPVKNHIFLMLHEPVGGSGKSTWVSRLCEPFDDWKLSWELSDLADSKNFFALPQNFVVVFDEMSKPDRLAADTLKQQITATVNDVRKLYDNTVYRLPQNCTFIGTSNKPLPTLIQDSGSMRRFWQMDCLEKMDWDAINALDVAALWRSIDENLGDGYLVDDQITKARVKQAELATPTAIEEFVDEMALKPVENQPTTTIPAAVLYQEFREWCPQHGHKIVPTAINFARLNGLPKHKGTGGRRDAVIRSANRLTDEHGRWRKEIL